MLANCRIIYCACKPIWNWIFFHKPTLIKIFCVQSWEFRCKHVSAKSHNFRKLIPSDHLFRREKVINLVWINLFISSNWSWDGFGLTCHRPVPGSFERIKLFDWSKMTKKHLSKTSLIFNGISDYVVKFKIWSI